MADESASQRATELYELSEVLAEAGSLEASLQAVDASVALRRELARADPGGFSLLLALTLCDRSNRLARMGRRADAADAVADAVTICRGVALVQPEARRQLAWALMSQSVHQAATGDLKCAVATVTEAVEILLDIVVAGDRDARPDLAMALNNQANRLFDVEDVRGARRASDRAIEIRRALIRDGMGRFRADLAVSLTSRSTFLVDVDPAAAVDASSEALEFYDEVARIEPTSFQPERAAALNNHSNALRALGDDAAALRAIERAARVYRDLCQARPGVFEGDLAKVEANRARLRR